MNQKHEIKLFSMDRFDCNQNELLRAMHSNGSIFIRKNEDGSFTVGRDTPTDGKFLGIIELNDGETLYLDDLFGRPDAHAQT